MRPIRAHSTPPSYKVVDEMSRSDERAARLDAKVKTFARSQPSRKPYTDTPALDVEQSAKPTPDLHSAFMSVADSLIKHPDKIASLQTVGHAFKQVALKIKPQAPDIGRSVAPKRVSAPEIGERDTSGLFGDEEDV
jgi:hypothetical protein